MDGYDILLVGDGSNLFWTLTWALGHKGYRIRSAAQLEAALEALVKKNFDLIIARLTKEDKDILGVLKRAKFLNPAAKVMVVNDQHQIFPWEAYEMNLDDYVMMPITPAELRRRVCRCLEKEAPEKVGGQTAAASQVNERVLRTLKCMFWEIRGSIAATMEGLRRFVQEKHGETHQTAADQLWEAASRLNRIMNLSEDFFVRIGTQTPKKPEEPEILDLVHLAEPVGNEDSIKAKGRTRQVKKREAGRKKAPFKDVIQKQDCHMCSEPRYGINSVMTGPVG
ncbi:MAG: response regulator [Deltaproteobacteria bacterium]|nr:response regulator [Deltaproteobacteria bacterium]